MANQEHIKSLWQTQAVETSTADLARLRTRGGQLRRFVLLVMGVEFLMSAFCIVYIANRWRRDPQDLATTLIDVSLVALLIWVVVFRYLSRVTPAPRSESLGAHLDYLIFEHEQRLTWQKRKPLWYSVPAIAGFGLVIFRIFATTPEGTTSKMLTLIIVLIIAGGFGLRWNAERTEELEREIDELKSMREDI